MQFKALLLALLQRCGGAAELRILANLAGQLRFKSAHISLKQARQMHETIRKCQVMVAKAPGVAEFRLARRRIQIRSCLRRCGGFLMRHATRTLSDA